MCRSEAKASKGLVVLGAVSWASWAWASEYEAAVIPQLLGTASHRHLQHLDRSGTCL